MDNKPVATIQKNSREEIRISLAEFKGYKLIGTRVWARKDDGGDVPTKSGISVRVEKLDEYIQAPQSARAAAVKEGWI